LSENLEFGSDSLASYASEYNANIFVIQQMIKKIRTIDLVEVVSVTNSGGLSAVGFVDVRVLVRMMDGSGNGHSHNIIHNIPYFRLQGGSNAIILDPQVGDIGMCGFCSRDISGVKNTKKEANPSTPRSYSFSDGLYFGGMLNGVPTQYIQFSSSGITMHSPTKITLSAPNVEINGTSSTVLSSPAITMNGPMSQGSGSYGGNATFGGSITATGEVTATGTALHTHTHSGVETGSGSTGAPN